MTENGKDPNDLKSPDGQTPPTDHKTDEKISEKQASQMNQTDHDSPPHDNSSQERKQSGSHHRFWKHPQEETPEEAIEHQRRHLLDKEDIHSFWIRLSVLIVFLGVVFVGIFRIVPVQDDDMKPFLDYKDVELVFRYPQHLYTNDVIVYNQDGTLHTGRIVAMPQETVEISDDQKLYVNGTETDNDEIDSPTPAYQSSVVYPVTLGQDEYFVLGDNRQTAMDSRQTGPVERSQIVGKVISAIRRSGFQ
ncbi:signal peptidase I [Allobaculum sp. JKK-2023]|uniref:signal peptidase I n=1 Tax=Allobaculum sp. JKK-2023 TaxID=3108943 RepID=UPI002B06032B|nr:signal peptidase I [Allobaculum sp. JKK-2023]